MQSFLQIQKGALAKGAPGVSYIDIIDTNGILESLWSEGSCRHRLHVTGEELVVLGSAKLNGLNPELYLRTVLARIADHPISRIGDLLPWNLVDQLKTHSLQVA